MGGVPWQIVSRITALLAHFDPRFIREDFVSIIKQSAWPE